MNRTHASVVFSGFIEEESSLLNLDLIITSGPQDDDEQFFYGPCPTLLHDPLAAPCRSSHCTRHPHVLHWSVFRALLRAETLDPAERWDGPLDKLPTHASRVMACVVVRNTVSLDAYKCTDPIAWDTMAPVIQALSLANPLSVLRSDGTPTAAYIAPECPAIGPTDTPFPWGPPVQQYHLCEPAWTNSTGSIRFRMTMSDVAPHYASIQLRWTVLDYRAESFEESGDWIELSSKNMSNYTSGCNGQLDSRYCQGNVVLEVGSNDVSAFTGAHDKVLYLHLWICDAYANCRMGWGYPMHVDQTPPPTPGPFVADYKLPTTVDNVHHFFVDEYRLALAWSPSEADSMAGQAGSDNVPTGGPIIDPESGPTFATYEIYRLHPSDTPTLFYGTLNASCTGSGGFVVPRGGGCGFQPYGKVQVRPPTDPNPYGFPSLELGAQYRVEVHLYNRAGSVTHLRPPPVMADYTPPTYSMPLLDPSGLPLVRADESPPASDTWEGTRGFNWIAPGAQTLRVRLNASTCMDPESGIYRLNLTVGTGVGTDDLMSSRTLPAQPYEVNLSWPIAAELAGYAECDDCGPIFYLGVHCTNWAAVSRSMAPVLFRVDGSLPQCNQQRPLLGHGQYYWAQPEADKLLVSNYDTAFYDRESGVLRIEYTLEDLTDGSTVDLPSFGHDGLPHDYAGRMVSSRYLRGLSLQHAHWYRINATAINGVGSASAPCSTTATVIDQTPPTAGVVYVVTSQEEGLREQPTHTDFQFETYALRTAVRGFVDNESAIEAFWYKVRQPDGTLLVPESWGGTHTYHAAAVQLTHGQQFVASFRAVNHAGLETAHIESNVVTVDATPPILATCYDGFVAGVPVVEDSDDVAFVGTSRAELRIRLESEDPESGIRVGWWCLGVFPGSCEVVGHTSVPKLPFSESVATLNGLIDNVIYYTTICELTPHSNSGPQPLPSHAALLPFCSSATLA